MLVKGETACQWQVVPVKAVTCQWEVVSGMAIVIGKWSKLSKSGLILRKW